MKPVSHDFSHDGESHLPHGAAIFFTAGHFGAVAQLGEHLLCKQGVAGSIPVRSIAH